MTLDASLLRRATLVNLERLARSLGIDPSEKAQWPIEAEWRAVLERYVLEVLKVDRMRARVARYQERKRVA